MICMRLNVNINEAICLFKGRPMPRSDILCSDNFYDLSPLCPEPKRAVLVTCGSIAFKKTSFYLLVELLRLP